MKDKDLRSTDVPAPITYPLKNGDAYELGSTKILEYMDVYKNIDVYQELLKARMWNIDNPTKRKTTRGICKHLNQWLSAAAEKNVNTKTSNNQQWRNEYV